MADANSKQHPLTWELLLHEHSHVRDSSRNFWALLAALTSIGVVVLGGVVTLAQQPTCRTKEVRDCVPPSVWAIVPLVPLALTSLLVQQVAMHQIRSGYNRDLERAIRTHPRRLEEALGTITLADGANIAPALGEVNNQLFRVTVGKRAAYWLTLFPLFCLSILTFASFFILNGAVVVVAYNKVHRWDARGEFTAFFLLGLMIVTLAGLYSALAGRDIFERAARASGLLEERPSDRHGTSDS